MHRVTLPHPESASDSNGSPSFTRARYSIPYFVAPDHDAIVRCLQSCVTAERPSKYRAVKWAEYGEHISKYMYKKDAAEDLGE